MGELSGDARVLSGCEAASGGPAVTQQRLTPAQAQFAQELFERHRFSLYGYLNRLLHSREEAKEILQESYLRVLRQPNFDRLRANARAYLFQTATNLARDHFRRKSSHDLGAEREVFSAGGLDEPHWESWPDLALEGEETGRIIIRALRSMEAPVRSALLLHRFRELTHGQIAARLGVCERTVERYIKEGLSIVAQRLKAEL